STSSRCGSRCSRGSCCSPPCVSARRDCCACATGSTSMAEARPAAAVPLARGRLSTLMRRADPGLAWAFACIVAVLLAGSLYSSSFLSPDYLLQQLKVASFLGVIATGTMIVVLLGQIDLSVPWVVAVGGMMATAATGWGAW